VRRLLLGLAVAAAVLGCQPAASFQAEGDCLADGRAPGTYPDLEAKLPRSLGGIGPANATGSATADVAPTTVDSGRSCSEPKLATLWSHAVRDLRFAGATWDRGNGEGIVSAFFTTPPGQPALEAAWMEEFYQSGAEASTKTENIEITRPSMGPAGVVFRLDTLNDLSLQSVVVWPAEDGVRVVIVATRVAPGADREAHETVVQVAVDGSAAPEP